VSKKQKHGLINTNLNWHLKEQFLGTKRRISSVLLQKTKKEKQPTNRFKLQPMDELIQPILSNTPHPPHHVLTLSQFLDLLYDAKVLRFLPVDLHKSYIRPQHAKCWKYPTLHFAVGYQ